MLMDLYIRDKTDGEIHKVGTDRHDSLYVDHNGVVQYCNMQNMAGTSDDYEFVPYMPYYDELSPLEKKSNSKS